MNKPLVLVVEDDRPIRNLIVTTLKAHDYHYLTAENGHSAIIEATSHNPDIVLLDLGLPDIDGTQVIESIRSWSNMPIIVISARSEDKDKITALDAGADDYLVKPVDIEELAARLRALLRRPGVRSPPVIRAGKLAFDVAARTARSGEHAIELTRREADLLELLIRRAGAVVRRSTIEEALHRFDEPVTPNAVEAIVSRLRHKLNDADQPDRLVTVRGMGYLLRDHGD